MAEAPGNDSKVGNSAARGGGQVRWMGAVFTTALFVMVALAILLVANTRAARLGAERRAAQGLDTLSKIATDWVATRVNIAQTDHCGCEHSEHSSVCVVTRTPGPAPQRSRARPVLVVEANGELRVTALPSACPAAAKVLEPTPAPIVHLEPTKAAVVAAPKPPEPESKLLSMTGLFAQLRAQFESAHTLDGVVLEALDEPKEPGAAPRVHTILELGQIPQATPSAKPSNEDGLLNGALAPREVTPRTIHFDRDGLEIATTQTWRLRGFSSKDPLDVMFHLGAVHFYVMTLAALILLLTWPAFKVWLMGPLERVASRDVIHLLVGIPVAVAAAVIYLRGALIYQDLNLLMHERVNSRVERTAAALGTTLGELSGQTRKVIDLLNNRYSASPMPGDRITACTGDFDEVRELGKLPTEAIGPLSEFVQLSQRVDPDHLLPFSLRLRRITGLGPDAAQLVRIGFPDPNRLQEPRARRTPMFRYPDRPYFTQAMQPGVADDAVFAEVNVSRTVGDRQLILSARGKPPAAPADVAGAARSEDELAANSPQVWTASFSLDENPRIPSGTERQPPGSGVAIVDSKGRVLVHTIPERILAENLFAATDAEDELVALTRRLALPAGSLGQNAMTVEGVTFDYYGEPQIAAIQRVQAPAALNLLGEAEVESWYVIAFEPDSAARAIIEDTVLIGVGVLAFLLLVRVILALGLAQLFGAKIEWWWPGSPDDQRRKQSFALAALVQVLICAAAGFVFRLGLAEMLVGSSLLITLSYLASRLLLVPRIREELSARPRHDTWFAFVGCVVCLMGLGCLWLGIFGMPACASIAVVGGLGWLARYWVSIPAQGSLVEMLFGKIEATHNVDTSPTDPLHHERGRWARVHLRWVYGPFVFFSSAVFAVFAYVSVQTVAELEVVGNFGTTISERAPEPLNWAGEVLGLLPVVGEVPEQIRRHALSRPASVSASYDEIVAQADQQRPHAGSKWRRTSLGRWLPRIIGWSLVLILSRALLIALSKRVFGLGIVNQVLPFRKHDGEHRHASRTFVLGASIPPAALAQATNDALAKPTTHSSEPAVGTPAVKHLRFDLGRGNAELVAWSKHSENDEAEGKAALLIDFLGCELVLFDKELRAALLTALEFVIARQLAGSAWEVRIVSERELMTAFIEREHEFATSPVDEQTQVHASEVQRWARVLSLFDFTVNRIFEADSLRSESVLPPPVIAEVSETPGALAGKPQVPAVLSAEQAIQAECLRSYVERELLWDPLLSTLYHRVLRKLEALTSYHGRPLSENEVLNTIVTMTGARHRYLWGTCTDQEKLLMIQLAHEGFVNPHRWALARRLCRRGLIDFGPNFRIRARSFDIFVHRALPPELLHAWERNHRSGQWQHASTALALVTLSLFGVLALGLPELTQGRMGVALTTLVGWFVVANRLNLIGGAAGGVGEALSGLFPKR